MWTMEPADSSGESSDWLAPAGVAASFDVAYFFFMAIQKFFSLPEHANTSHARMDFSAARATSIHDLWASAETLRLRSESSGFKGMSVRGEPRDSILIKLSNSCEL